MPHIKQIFFSTSSSSKKPLIESKTKRPLSLNEVCIKDLGHGAFGSVELCKIRATDGTEMEIAVKTVNLTNKMKSVGMTNTTGTVSYGGVSFFTQIEK